ncbi:MAG: outer membrane beta-barrel protein [Gemmatimonadaceae bacterium]
MRLFVCATILVAGATLAIPAHAQRSIHFGVAAGASVPVGVLDSRVGAGATGLAMVSMGPQDAPMGLRLDYQYSEFKGKSSSGTTAGDMHLNSATANLIVPFRAGYAKPYLIGGFGYYPLRLPGAAKRENDWGSNGGAGISFGLPFAETGAFLEVRYHAINRSNAKTYHFVPITFGVLF